MKKLLLMIAFLIGLTLSFTYGNTFSGIYHNEIPVSNPVFYETPVMEPELILEDWMLEILKVNPTYEQEIELEDWMIDMDKFYRSEEIIEVQPELEEWMFKNWFEQENNQPELILEDWMFHFS